MLVACTNTVQIFTHMETEAGYFFCSFLDSVVNVKRLSGHLL